MNKLDTIKLNNGLTIYLYNDSRRHSTFFQFITLCGGATKDFVFNKKEYHMQDGLAHILEHYIVECNDYGNFLDKLGERQMNTNASTHANMTRYYFNTVEDVSYGIETLLSGIYNVTFSEDKLEKIKKPILQEIRGKSDNKFYHSNNLMYQNIFNHYSYRNIGGMLDEVFHTTIDELKIFYEAFYQPSNQFIVIAGNFDKDNVLQIIKKFYKEKIIRKKDVELISIKEDKNVRKKEDILYFPTPLEYVEITFKIDISKFCPKERLDLDFYLGCFYNQHFGITSPIYKELVEKKVITSSINCYDNKIYHYLLISIGSYTYNVEIFKKSILKVIKEMRSFDKEKFELDKNASIVNMILRDEDVMKMIFPFVENIVNFDYPYLDTIEDLESLNFSDYKKSIKSLDFSNYTIITITEKEKK